MNAVIGLSNVSGMVLVAMLGLAVTHNPAYAEAGPNANRKCSVSTLRGGYGFHVGATVASTGRPVAVVGRQIFDGNGNYTGKVAINADGTIIHADDFGTYSVNADCTGKIFSGGGGGTFEFVLVDGGAGSYFLQTDPSATVFQFTGSKKQHPDYSEEPDVLEQARRNRVKQCSDSTLQGTYGFQVGATVTPAGSPVAVLGFQTFDGNGNYTATVTINASGTIIHADDFGTYAVDGDCTGKILSAAGGGTFEFVVVDGGRETYSLHTDPSSGVFLLAVARKQFPGKKHERADVRAAQQGGGSSHDGLSGQARLLAVD
jgi:hypothetical protein